MKQTKDSSLRNESLKWMAAKSIEEKGDLAFKYYGLYNYPLDNEEIEHIYQQEKKPTAIIGSGVEEKKYWVFGGMVDGYGLRRNDGKILIEQGYNGLHDEETKNEILTALNNYQSLRDSNAELLDVLIDCKSWFYTNAKRLKIPLEGVGAPGFFENVQSAINKAKSIK